MEPESSIESASLIRVVILPVGDVSASTFRDYSRLVMRHRRVGLTSARSFYVEHQKSPFQHQPWATGALQFRFLPGGASRSPWEDFQSHRKILGVIGLCHCPQSPDIGEAYEDFMSACKAYPAAQSRRLFAFNPSDGQVEQDDKKKANLILFPPADPQKMAFMMQTMMQDFAASLLMAFESWVLHSDPVGALLTTPLDLQQPPSSEEVSKAKKRRLGRTQKTMGDYCLLAASPLDAHAHYATAMELARLTGDHFWLAGAIEGSVSALLAEKGEFEQALEEEVQGRYLELIPLYRRLAAAVIFEVEAVLKLARFLTRRGVTRDVVELLGSATELSKQLPTQSDRLVLYMDVARLYSQIGYDRKAAFFARQVAQLYQQQDSQYAAISALQGQGGQPLGGAAAQQQREGHWDTLQMDILGDMLAVAVRAGDPLAAWTAAARLLRGHYPLITPAGQYALAAALSTLHGHPPHAAQAQIVKRMRGGNDEWWAGPAPTGPFIYTPFTSKGSESSDVLWVTGEVAQVAVELANPCAFEVVVESIFLSVHGCDFEAFPLALSIPANTASHPVLLSGLPRAEGPAVIRGCFVRCFGLLSEHLFDSPELAAATLGKVPPLVDPFRGAGTAKPRVSPPASVLVLPHLPLVVASLGGGEAAPVIFEGEVREVEMRLTNAGVLPVTEVHVSVQGKHKEHVQLVAQERLLEALPLAPGASVTMPIKLVGHFQAAAAAAAAGVGAGGGDRGHSHGAAGGPGPQLGSTAKEDAMAVLSIHYAGPSPVADGDAASTQELPPGRRLAVPLRLHVHRGLYLVRARVLTMGGLSGADASSVHAGQSDKRSSRRPAAAAAGTGAEAAPAEEEQEVTVLVREAKGKRVMELELWNGTDVGFDVTLASTAPTAAAAAAAPSSSPSPSPSETPPSSEPASQARTVQINRECSGRLLIPLDTLHVPSLDAALGRSLTKRAAAKARAHAHGWGGDGGAGEAPHASVSLARSHSKHWSAEERRLAEQLEVAVDELCAQITVTWVSGRNSRGQLYLKDAVRDALEGPAADLLLPEVLSFSFRVGGSQEAAAAAGEAAAGAAAAAGPAGGGRGGESGPAVAEEEEFRGGSQKKGSSSSSLKVGGSAGVAARQLTGVELVVRSSSSEAMAMSLSVTCRDVSGANCLGPSRNKALMLWAEYILLAAALVKPRPEAVCYSSLPQKIHVVGSYMD
eukprot:jgi/Mesen1/7330/ME000376S06481